MRKKLQREKILHTFQIFKLDTNISPHIAGKKEKKKPQNEAECSHTHAAVFAVGGGMKLNVWWNEVRRRPRPSVHRASTSTSFKYLNANLQGDVSRTRTSSVFGTCRVMEDLRGHGAVSPPGALS